MQSNKKTRQSLRRQAAASRGVDDVSMQLDNVGASSSSNIPPPTTTNLPSSIDTSTQSTVQIMDNNHHQNRATNAASSSLQSNTETPSTNNATVPAITPATDASTTVNLDFANLMSSGGQSEERQQKRQGYTSTGDRIQSCGCNNKTRCREIMWEWASLGEDYNHMIDYVIVPKKTAKTNDLGKHINGYREGCILHLLGQKQNQSEEVKEKLAKNNQIPIAIHHFEKCLREDITKSKEIISSIDKYRSSKENGIKAGLKTRDLCKVNGTDNIKSYYTIPNVKFEDIEHELDQAKKMHQLKSAAKSSTTKQSRTSKKAAQV